MSTYTLIQSQTLASSAASVTFSAIPSTFTDIVLKFAARSDDGLAFDYYPLVFNSDTTAIYSLTHLYQVGSTAYSGRQSALTNSIIYYGNGSTSTANTYSSSEIYIPNYTSTTSKPISSISVLETTTNRQSAGANLYRNTSAISSLTLTCQGNFVTGSSFYLYGISSS